MYNVYEENARDVYEHGNKSYSLLPQTLYNKKWVDSKEVFWFKKYRLSQGVKKIGNEKYIFNEKVKVDVNIWWNGY